jgi:hypothetical protein
MRLVEGFFSRWRSLAQDGGWKFREIERDVFDRSATRVPLPNSRLTNPRGTSTKKNEPWKILFRQ